MGAEHGAPVARVDQTTPEDDSAPAEHTVDDENEAQKWYTTVPAIISALTALVAAIGGILALILGGNEAPPPPPVSSTVIPQSVESVGPLPGTNPLGWTDYPYAQCDPGNTAAAMALTTKSAIVICQTSPGNFYYRGVRVSGGDGIELADAVRSSGGFDVKNPIDGTRYQVRSDGLTIRTPDGKVFSEPKLKWWSK